MEKRGSTTQPAATIKRARFYPVADPAVETVPEPVAEQQEAVDREEIARLAYAYWEARGCQGGSPEEDWVRAEQELRARRGEVG